MIKEFFKKILPPPANSFHERMDALFKQFEDEKQRSKTIISELYEEKQRSETIIKELYEEKRRSETIFSELYEEKQRSETIIKELYEEKRRSETIISELKEGEQSLKNVKKQLDNVQKTSDEVLWGQIFGNTISGSDWLRNLSIWPGRGAVGYSFLYVLYRILNELKPKHILDIGLGITTRVISKYAEFNKDCQHLVVEHDDNWISFFEQDFRISERTKVIKLGLHKIVFKEDPSVTAYQKFAESLTGQKFNLVLIDGPFGYAANFYSRIDILSILPGCLDDSFIIMIDDYDRIGEQRMVELIKQVLSKHSIKYIIGKYSGIKQFCIITSEDLRFLKTL